jgi:molecular chaperone DnaJ
MNAYKVLGLHFGADEKDVATAFRSLAKTCHPDLHPDDPKAAARFKEINEAREQLSKELDEARAPKQRPRKPATGTYDRPPPSVRILHRNVFLTVREAIEGCRRLIEGVSGRCAHCEGSGKVHSDTPVECTGCYGSGLVKQARRGFITLSVACPDCAGSGKVAYFRCHECGGFGTVNSDACEVDIPPASRNGDHLIVPNGASDRKDNVIGDLDITIVVRDPGFRMVDNDIETAVDLDVWDAVLGCTVEVASPSGTRFKLTIPRETRHGTRFRIHGQGLFYTEEKGDLVAIARIKPLFLKEPGVADAMLSLKKIASEQKKTS